MQLKGAEIGEDASDVVENLGGVGAVVRVVGTLMAETGFELVGFITIV